MPEFVGTQRFQVHRRIGAGAFGVVYEAYDRERNARVALKTLARLDPGALYRFKREFRTLADVSHENLVELHELVSVGDQWFFTMELIAGVDFLGWCWGRARSDEALVSPFTETLLAQGAPAVIAPASSQSGERPLTRPGGAASSAPSSAPTVMPVRVRGALRQLAKGVADLHALGILHRDIKPSNVLVSDSGRVVLVDFGIATELHRPDATEVGISGTPAYMAPEQGAGLPLTEAADWYSVGVVLYEALTGVLPFVGAPMQMLMDKQLRAPRRPRDLCPDTPEDLDELCMALLRTHPAERPTGTEVVERLWRLDGEPSSRERTSARPSTPPPSLSSQFVGRADALAVLSKAFRAAQQGRPAMVFVHGRSGMGKSALVQHFVEVIAQSDSRRDRLGAEWLDADLRRDAVVLVGRCYERESVPYKAFDSLIDALTHYLIAVPREEAVALVPVDAAALARVFPVLRRVPAIVEAPRRARDAVDPQQLRTRAFGALRELLARLADRRPVVVFIDDLQWGDVDSAALLAELVAPPDPPAILLVLGYRTEDAETSPMLAALASTRAAAEHDREVHTIEIGALGVEDARRLAALLVGAEPPASGATTADPGALDARIAQESGGSPFFIGELARWVRSEPTRATDAAVRLEDVIEERLSMLPPHARRLLEVLAVAGRPIASGVAFRAGELAEDQRASALDVLRAAHLVRVGGVRAIDRIEPFHDRIRETVAATLPADSLRSRHHQLALALTEAGEADPEALYTHFRAAGELASAAAHAEEAAARAARALAFERAAQLFRIALELTDEPTRVHGLRVSLGDALANAGLGPEAAAAYMAATEGAPPTEQLELRRRAAEQLLCSGHIDQGLDVIEAVLGRVGMRLASTPVRAVIALLLHRFWLTLRGLGFREHEAASVAPAVLTRIDVCWSTAVGLALADTIRAAHFASKNLSLALAAGEPGRLCRALALEAGFIGTLGASGRPRADALLAAARPLVARTAALPANEALLAMSAGVTDYFGGRWTTARTHLESAEQRFLEQGVGSRWELDSTAIFLLGSLVYVGEFDELSRRLPAALRSAQERGDLYFLTYLNIGEMNVAWLIDDDPAAAKAAIDETMQRWSHRSFQIQHWDELRARCQHDLYVGDAAGAWSTLQARWRHLQASLLFRVQLVKGLAWHLRGRCALAAATTARDPSSLLRVARRDARRLFGERLPWSSALGELLVAGAASLEGRTGECAAALWRAIEGFDQAGMQLHAAVARQRLSLVGEGEQAIAAHDAFDHYVRTHRVKAPEKTARMMAPGFRTE